MDTAAQYARALYALMEETPKNAAAYLHNLDGALKRRGHRKLLPRIFSEYQKLELAKNRSNKYKEVTEDDERTRVLLELYRKLTH